MSKSASHSIMLEENNGMIYPSLLVFILTCDAACTCG